MRSGLRGTLVRQGRNGVGRLFRALIGIDLICQVVAFHWLFPVQAPVVAAVLAFPSDVLTRGPVNRVAGGLGRGPGHDAG